MTKLSKTNFKVEIKNANSPYILFLNQTFDVLWTARRDGAVLSDHFIVNGFANGWLVGREGDYDIEIFYKIYLWE